MADNKTKPSHVDPNAYIEAIENQVRRDDAEYLLALIGTITGAPAKMWGPTIIGFGRYHYKYASGREGDSFLSGFAPRKTETVFYLTGIIEKQSDFLEQLGPHRMGKSCLYIKNLAKIDRDILTQLITQSVAAIRATYPQD